MAASYELINVRHEAGIDYVTLNRPNIRNAVNDAVIEELTHWADAAATDRRLRLAVLGGAGKTFCAGADLGWMSRTIDYEYEANLHDAWALARLFARLDTLPVPLVGRVHGAALGGGVGLVAVCDIAVATEDTVFGFTEVKLGIVPAVISPYAVAKIGASAARHRGTACVGRATTRIPSSATARRETGSTQSWARSRSPTGGITCGTTPPARRASGWSAMRRPGMDRDGRRREWRSRLASPASGTRLPCGTRKSCASGIAGRCGIGAPGNARRGSDAPRLATVWCGTGTSPIPA